MSGVNNVLTLGHFENVSLQIDLQELIIVIYPCIIYYIEFNILFL